MRLMPKGSGVRAAEAVAVSSQKSNRDWACQGADAVRLQMVCLYVYGGSCSASAALVMHSARMIEAIRIIDKSLHSLEHRGSVDHDIDGIRLNADGARVAFRKVLAADGHAWRLHIGEHSHTVFNPALCAALGFRFAQGTGFSVVGAANWHG
jgi:hypothetical protein